MFFYQRCFQSCRHGARRLAGGTTFRTCRSPSSKPSSTNSQSTTTSRDTRLAGRLRFYREVGVVEVSPPWEYEDASNSRDIVESPISAGVDGTDSASGVPHISEKCLSTSSWEYLLSPRKPGTDIGTALAPATGRWFGISLDGRMMKTPMGQPLAVPSQRLAYGIAAEWDAQSDRLQPANMPLMALTCTALDQASHHPHVYREQALNFLSTDTTCFWADPTEDRILHRRQNQAWKELHEFVTTMWGHPPAVAMGASEGMLMARKRGESKPSSGLPHARELSREAKSWTESLDAWHLVALSSICSQAKSFLVAWAALQPESPMVDLQKAVEASRVEEEFQITSWGLVEGGHDYDRLNCSIQLHSAQLFARSIVVDNELH